MAHAYPRHVRFASTIQQVIAPELHGLVPDGLVTVTRVSVTPDLLDATVHYSVIGANDSNVQELLDEMVFPLRRHLARELSSKRVPRLVFVAEHIDGSDVACMGS